MRIRRYVRLVAVFALSFGWVCRVEASVRLDGNIEIQVPNTPNGIVYSDSYDQSLDDTFTQGVSHNTSFEDGSSQQLIASSAGGAGFVRARAYAVWDKPMTIPSAGSVGLQLSASSQALATFDDIIISGVVGGPSTVTTSINFHATGSQLLHSLMTPDTPSATTGYLVAVSPNDTFGFVSQGGMTSINGAPPSAYLSPGTTPLDSPNGVYTTASFTAPVDTPFSVTFELDANASVSGLNRDAFNLVADSFFEDTLSFATDRAVFNLADGYTASSLSANITNNRFTVVPEPPRGFLTAMVSFALIAQAGRREGSRRRS